MGIIRNILKKLLKQLPIDLYWSFHGASLINRPLPEIVQSIHFVCKGNICRSAFAHMLGHQLFSGLDDGPQVSVSSSGLDVSQPEDSPVDAVKIANSRFGVSLEDHTSIPLTTDICKREDVIIVMEGWQLSEVQKRFPAYKNKCYLLAQFELGEDRKIAGYEKYNIVDPYGKGEKAFFNSFSRIERCLNGLSKNIGNRA